jgi:radical SAM superfamily enzyme YgiQ (UPF0313 family)
MRVLFVQNIWREYFGVMYMAAGLRAAGHDVEIRVAPTVAGAVRAVRETRPGLVGFSFTNCEQQYALRAAAAIKQAFPEAVTIAGGPHPTLHPELALRGCFDFVCRGEGEQTIVELADRLDHHADVSDVRNLAFARNRELIANPVRPLIEDLGALPHPWRDGYYRYAFLRNNPVKFFFTGRGCPFGCTFCFNRAFRDIYPNKNEYVRHFSPERIVAEIEEVRARWPVRVIRFEDDVFAMNKPWLRRFLTLYAERIRLPYLCYLRAGESEETIQLLADTGCRTALFGVETGDEARRNQLLCKGVTNEQIEQTAALLRKHRIHFFTSNILALPGEHWADALATLRLNQRLRAPDVWCSIFQPYAGLPITEQAIRDGLLARVDDDVIGANTFADNALRNPDAERIFNLHKFFYPLARWPRLEKILLPLTRWKPNRLFHYFWLIFYVHSYRQHTGVSRRRIALEGLFWFRQFLSTTGTRR